MGNIEQKIVRHEPEYSGYEQDRPHEECGVFGIYLPTDIQQTDPQLVTRLVFNGIFQNQHRGEESAGIATANGYRISDVSKHMGLISTVYQHFQQEEDIEEFFGHIALAHTRYSTTGASKRVNAGPFTANSELGTIAVSHNGNVTNAAELVRSVLPDNAVMKSTTDSEIIAYLIAQIEGDTWDDKIAAALSLCEGSFSLGLLTNNALYAARDAHGIRPLFWAEYDDNGRSVYAVSSETPAFLHLNGYKIKQIKEVQPGTVMKFDDTGVTVREYKKVETEAFCGLEITYLSRADGLTRNGRQIDTVRRSLGAEMARLYPPPSDIDAVTYIPESSRQAAEGYAEELSRMWNRPVLCKTSMLKGRYPGLNGKSRGFISPDHKDRKSVAANYYPMEWVTGGKILLVDDSLIRGTTTIAVIQMLRESGAAEIHLRIPWPPVKGFCPLGTDINMTDHLLYVESHESLERMRETLGVDSLAFLTPPQYQAAVDRSVDSHFGLCMGCTDGNYPVTLFQADKTVFEKKC